MFGHFPLLNWSSSGDLFCPISGLLSPFPFPFVILDSFIHFMAMFDFSSVYPSHYCGATSRFFDSSGLNSRTKYFAVLSPHYP